MPETHRGESTGDNRSNNKQLEWMRLNPAIGTVGSWSQRIPGGHRNDQQKYTAVVFPKGNKFGAIVSHASTFHKTGETVRRPLTDEEAGPSPEGFQQPGDPSAPSDPYGTPNAATFRTRERAMQYAQAVMNNDLRGKKAKPVLTATRQAFRRNRKAIASLPETEE